jgi:hypothetical protein
LPATASTCSTAVQQAQSKCSTHAKQMLSRCYAEDITEGFAKAYPKASRRVTGTVTHAEPTGNPAQTEHEPTANPLRSHGLTRQDACNTRGHASLQRYISACSRKDLRESTVRMNPRERSRMFESVHDTACGARCKHGASKVLARCNSHPGKGLAWGFEAGLVELVWPTKNSQVIHC